MVGPHIYAALGWSFRRSSANGNRRAASAPGCAATGAVTPWNDVDSVNANVVAWLGDRPETRPAQRWLANQGQIRRFKLEGGFDYVESADTGVVEIPGRGAFCGITTGERSFVR